MRNEVGNRLVDFAIAHHPAIVNTLKKGITSVQFTSVEDYTPRYIIFYVEEYEEYVEEVKVCKVLPKETVTKLYKLVVCKMEEAATSVSEENTQKNEEETAH